MKNNKTYIIIIVGIIIAFLWYYNKQKTYNSDTSSTILSFVDDGKLTREKAKEILLKSQKIPEYLVKYFCLSENAYLNRTYPDDFVLDLSYNEYINLGLFEDCTPDEWVGKECKFTAEGKKYIVTSRINRPQGFFTNDYRYWPPNGGMIDYRCSSQLVGVKLGSVQFGEITGITESNYGGQNSATVEYKLILSNVTPFGESLPNGGSVRDRFGQGNMRATFVKYDDGWRIQ